MAVPDEKRDRARHWALPQLSAGVMISINFLLEDWGALWLALGAALIIYSAIQWTDWGSRRAAALDNLFGQSPPLEIISSVVVTLVMIMFSVYALTSSSLAPTNDVDAARYEEKFNTLYALQDSIIPQADKIAERLRDPDISEEEEARLFRWIALMEEANYDIACKLLLDGPQPPCPVGGAYIHDLKKWNAQYEKTVRDSQAWLATP